MKKFKILILKTSPKIGDKAFLMAVLGLGVFLPTPLKRVVIKGVLKLPHDFGENVAPVLIGGGLAV